MKKQPKQERSKQIVDAVLNGATRILSKMRLQDTTTNKIAEVAGVGIGSLYDYFPNKKAIVSSLIDRRVNDVVQKFDKLLRAKPEASLEEVLDDILLFFKTDFLQKKEFLREIFYLAPEQGRMEGIYLAQVGSSQVLAQFLHERAVFPTEEDCQRKAFMLTHGVLGVIQSYVMIHPEYFTADQMEKEVHGLIRYHLFKK